MDEDPKLSVTAAAAPLRARATGYPEDLAVKIRGREKRPLGDLFGLKNFGVNHTRLRPGAQSALHHAHGRQDEFVYILEGTPTLVCGTREKLLHPGDCAGFAAGTGEAHHLANRGTADVVYLEIGDRSPGDSVIYPDDDLAATAGPDGAWHYARKDGSPLA